MFVFVFVLKVIFIALMIFWWFAPIIYDITEDYHALKMLYPNGYKRVLLIFLHGPIAMIYFGYKWLMIDYFNNGQSAISDWFEKE